MTFILYRKDPACIVNRDEDSAVIAHPQIVGDEPGTSGGDDPNYVIIEQTLDPSVPLPNWYLNAAGNALENKFSGKTDSEADTLRRQEQETLEISQIKASKTAGIKVEAKTRLEAIDWKIQRATEEDLLNGNNSAMTAVANEKKAIRDANNAHEAALNALTDIDQVRSFNTESF